MDFHQLTSKPKYVDMLFGIYRFKSYKFIRSLFSSHYKTNVVMQNILLQPIRYIIIFLSYFITNNSKMKRKKGEKTERKQMRSMIAKVHNIFQKKRVKILQKAQNLYVEYLCVLRKLKKSLEEKMQSKLSKKSSNSQKILCKKLTG